MTTRLRRMSSASDGDRGFSLVELLVSMTIFSLLGGLLLGVVITTGRATDTNTIQNDLNEEARNVINRLSRELREAQRIDAVANPVGPGFSPDNNSSITLHVDFDGDGTIEATAADPEVLTYTYRRVERRLVLSAGGATVPVLAGNVESFALTYLSRVGDADRLALDGLSNAAGGACGALPPAPLKDGELTWSELDADPSKKFGDCSGALTAAELPYVNAVGIDMSMLKQPRQQHYRTRVDLRNNRA